MAVEVDEDEERLDADWQQNRVAFLRGVLDRNRLRRTVALFAAGGGERQQNVEQRHARPGHGHHGRAGERRAVAGVADRVTGRARGRSASGRSARQNTPAGYASADQTLEDLAGEFAVEEVQVVRAKYATGGRHRLLTSWAARCCCSARATGLGRNDFSNLKTFTAPNEKRASGTPHMSAGRR